MVVTKMLKACWMLAPLLTAKIRTGTRFCTRLAKTETSASSKHAFAEAAIPTPKISGAFLAHEEDLSKERKGFISGPIHVDSDPVLVRSFPVVHLCLPARAWFERTLSRSDTVSKSL